MIVLSHRGYWHAPDERNTDVAFRRSFDLGFGTETDVRDLAGKLVISHDPPVGGEMPLEQYLALPGVSGLPQAINVKADGLAKPIGEALRAAGVADWFVFDMSLPDTLQQIKAGNPVFVRMSEYEPTPQLLGQAAGVWLDAFESRWWTAATIEALIDGGKRVCVVSPELHRRAHLEAWEALRAVATLPGLMLCTDLPETARTFFKGQP